MSEFANTQPLSVLVIDDDNNLRSSICLNLEAAGFSTASLTSPKEALDKLEKENFDIVLCDLRMPDMDGLSFIKKCREQKVSAAIVLMTAFGSHDLALEALRAGAYDYISKPFEIEELVFTLRKIQEKENLKAENAALKSAINQRYNFSNIVARSEQMKEIFETIKRLASFNTTVLIVGESGTGKELLARAIHHNSPRRGKPFVAINCGAIPEHLMESELFGHKQGAFTDASRDKPGLFEEASEGTIFLDEIGEMPLHLQVKLLRALQEQKIRRIGDERLIDIDVRVIAATLRNLEKDVQEGRFRDDLFYRLNVVSIKIPPLRERPDDIQVLAEHFMKKHNKKLGLSIKAIEPAAMKCLLNYHWKGNVRELENCIERAMVLSESDSITVDSLPPQILKAASERGNYLPEPLSDDNLSIKQRTRALEIDLILRALKKTGGNRTHAAKVLEISHRALLYKLKEYGLSDVEKG
ncbi:MAG: sigma-54-dependent Fis family transcriptional regulator [Candidatus Dadabacteria bacterium]|nr:MAG: sigma-54-dependent Fis family transcriptional regulator [Candidatus Dadabacteria bacterium]